MTHDIKKTERGEIALKDVKLSKFVPYTHHVDEKTLATKNGYLLQVIKLDGFAFETADTSEINALKEIRNTLLRGISDPRFAIYHHIIRREIDLYPEGEFEGFCQSLNQAWRKKVLKKKLYINEQYITIVRRSFSGSLGILTSLAAFISRKADKAAEKHHRAKNHKALTVAADNIKRSFQSYGSKILSVYQDENGSLNSEPLEFLYYLINQESQKVALPRMEISKYLPSKRLFFGAESLEVRGASKSTLGAIISIKEYNDTTFPGMIDGLLTMPHELILTQSFGFINRSKSLSAIKTVKRQMKSADDDAISLQEELSEAADDVASNRIVFGEHHFSVLVKQKTKFKLDDAVTTTMEELQNLGVLAIREDVNMEAAYWAQLPANFAFIARKSPISSQNFASFASLHNFPEGKIKNNHWGNAVTMFETTSGTPYFFNFHHNDLGNFIVIGPSGTGKTVVLTFLMAQAQRFKPRSIFFDKDRGAEIFIRAIGGSYSVIKPGRATGFNPLQLENTPINKAFLRSWLGELVKPLNGDALSSSDRLIISEAIDGIYTVKKSHRRLPVLAELLSGHEKKTVDSLESRFAPWHSKGEYWWLFDNHEDTLSFENSTIGFDLTFILDDKIARTPAMMYMFHRVDETLTGQKTIIFIDEGWKALADPIFEERIKDWLKTIRKRNGVLGFGSQSTKDIINSGIADSVIEQSPTQIFMPNLKADYDSYKAFGLTDAEFNAIKTLGENSRCFLIKHGSHSVIAKLDLSGLDDILAVLSGNEENVNILTKIRLEHGENPEIWLPIFLKTIKEKNK